MCLFPIAIPQPLMRSARNLRLVDFGALPAPPDRKDLQKRALAIRLAARVPAYAARGTRLRAS